ncbi:MAG: GIY-YIG nuclease family protein [Lentisphaerae bacterium]|nr:GIY-YIG nuclease family protein [Lentisphaerota bacterium]
MQITCAIVAANETPAAYVLANEMRAYLYKGAARNLKERLKDHLAGRVARTKNRRPLFLVYLEYCKTYSDALRRERYLKSGMGRAWLKCHIKS